MLLSKRTVKMSVIVLISLAVISLIIWGMMSVSKPKPEEIVGAKRCWQDGFIVNTSNINSCCSRTCHNYQVVDGTQICVCGL